MANSWQALSIYLVLLFAQTCCSLKSSALFKMAISGNLVIAHSDTLIVGFIDNKTFSYEQK